MATTEYEIPEGFTANTGVMPCEARAQVTVLLRDGEYDSGYAEDFTWEFRACTVHILCYRILPTPKVKRWRAGRFHYYWIVNKEGLLMQHLESESHVNDIHFRIGNYFRSESEARASKKYQVMNEVEG